MRIRRLRTAAFAVGLGVATVLSGSALAIGAAPVDPTGGTGAVPRPAHCSTGDLPETGIQGQVPLADRMSGRSQQGYSCNLQLVGRYQGAGSSWVSPSYGHCGYISAASPTSEAYGTNGVRVVDAANPANPVLSDALKSSAFLGDTWESMRVNEPRGLLAGVSANASEGVAFFDIYDVKTDCAHPKLLNSILGSTLSIPSNVIGHEGNFSPDGLTYWASGATTGTMTAIDVSDPTNPRVVFTGSTGTPNHGFSFSPDGDRLYLAQAAPAGFETFDVSQIQNRALVPTITQISQASWGDGMFSQHTIPVTVQGHPYVIGVDEGGNGGAHIVDMADEKNPVVLRAIRLEIQQPGELNTRTADAANNGSFQYQSHYCAVDHVVDPTALACSYFDSGIRIFDIRDILHPREIAYYNPPAQVGKKAILTNSQHAQNGEQPPVTTPDAIVGGTLGEVQAIPTQGASTNLTADWCSSPAMFTGSMLYVTCQDNGFMALRFSAATYPIVDPMAAVAAAPVVAAPTVGATTVVGATGGKAAKVARKPTARRETHTATQPTRSLAFTGGPPGLPLLAVGLVAVALFLGGRRRSRRWRVTAAAGVLALTVGLISPSLPQSRTSVATSASAPDAADVAFVRDMTVHHQQALVLARVGGDRSSTQLIRTFAAQITAEQGYQIGQLKALAKTWGISPAGGVGLCISQPAIDALGRDKGRSLDLAFEQLMLVHHSAAIPMITDALRRARTPQVLALAENMELEQSEEIGYLATSLRVAEQLE